MAVTAEQLIKHQGGLRNGSLPVAATTTIYGGTMVFVNSGGFAVGIIASGANQFMGIARETYDNAAGGNGDAVCEFITEGDFELVGSGFTQADVGKDIYATDNYVVHLTDTNRTYIGRVVGFVSTTRVIVRINTVPSFDGTGGG